MGIERLPKYFMFARLLWRLLRPFGMALAKSTETEVDDDLITAADEFFSQDIDLP